jgi:hypothetical protein
MPIDGLQQTHPETDLIVSQNEKRYYLIAASLEAAERQCQGCYYLEQCITTQNRDTVGSQ